MTYFSDEQSGYTYEVREETATPSKQLAAKSYADNFAYVPPRSPNPALSEFEEEIEKMK